MTKFRGNIGLNRGPVESDPGIFSQVIEDVEVTGEMLNLGLGWQGVGMQDSLSAKHILSIIIPEEESVEFNEVVYVEWHSRRWNVTSIEYKRPRINLTLGGLYNG
jgi:hypothetical protein